MHEGMENIYFACCPKSSLRLLALTVKAEARERFLLVGQAPCILRPLPLPSGDSSFNDSHENQLTKVQLW